jgi:uncharacterized membrane protein YhaH (DUF805 family)
MFAPLLRLFFSFRGRMARTQFWLAGLALGIVFTVLVVFLESEFGRSASLIVYPPFFWSAFALSARRLRDSGTSPFTLLAFVIPVLGALWLTYLLGFRRGTQGDNQYGNDPRLIDSDYFVVKT